MTAPTCKRVKRKQPPFTLSPSRRGRAPGGARPDGRASFGAGPEYIYKSARGAGGA